MAQINKVLGLENKESFGLVHVVMSDGTEGTVFIGGECEVYYHRGKIKVFIKKLGIKG